MKAIWEALKLALFMIFRSKVRALLTALGILIGVSAVVIVVSLGSAVQRMVLQNVSTLGANTIFVFPEASQLSGARRRDLGRITEADGEAIAREAASVTAVSPFSSTGVQVLFGENNVLTQAMGVTLPYWQIRSYTFAKGQSFTQSDQLLKAKVCVIGDTVRENLFKNIDPIGQYIRIGRHSFRVVGLLERKGQSPFGEDQDDRILMPIGTYRSRIEPSAPGRVEMLVASASDERTVQRAVTQIDEILRQRHRIEPEDEPDFSINTQAEIRRTNETIFNTLSVLLSSIAAVSLFVGGIGVMNIMLVSVAERTREVGIRMAIGAKERDILLQFLIEAIALSLLGGALGILLAWASIGAIGRALEWEMTLPMEAVMLAIGTSTTIGVLFGFLPARQAAKLDPIEALRQEV